MIKALVGNGIFFTSTFLPFVCLQNNNRGGYNVGDPGTTPFQTEIGQYNMVSAPDPATVCVHELPRCTNNKYCSCSLVRMSNDY